MKQQGTAAVRRLRRAGRVPAVLYGNRESSLPISLDGHQLASLVRHHAHGLVRLEVGNHPHLALIKGLQWDTFGEHVLHADFQRVTAGQKVRLEVPVVLRGDPPGIAEGGVMEQHIYQTEIECPVESIPDHLEVNVRNLHLEQSILLRDIPVPADCHLTARGEELEQSVVEIRAKLELPEEALAPAAAAEGAEPELITRKKPEEGEEEKTKEKEKEKKEKEK